MKRTNNLLSSNKQCQKHKREHNVINEKYVIFVTFLMIHILLNGYICQISVQTCNSRSEFLTPGLSLNMDTRQWRRCFNIDAFQTEKRQSQKTKQIEKFKSKNSLNMCT